MALKCGIVGLPNVGKSTLFNCLSNAKAQSANFPFCTIEPNIGTISVPDPRLEKLEALVNPERVIRKNRCVKYRRNEQQYSQERISPTNGRHGHSW